MIRTQSITLFRSDKPPVYVHREHAFGSSEDGYLTAHSQLLVCPSCYEPWALLKFVDDRMVWPIAQFCDHCQPPPEESGWYPVSGSLLVEESWGVVDRALLAALPTGLLQRELNLHLGTYEVKP